MRVIDFINEYPLLFDGAIGTYLADLDVSCIGKYEDANVNHPELVYKIHKDYIEAGANAITTNTFAANRLNYNELKAAKLIAEGCKLAFKAAEGKTLVFGSIGQINAEKEIRESEYMWVASQLAENGITNFIFETQSKFDGIEEACKFIKEKVQDSFIIVSFSVNGSGFTTEGLFTGELASSVRKCSYIDAFGLNCGSSAGHMKAVSEGVNTGDKLFCVMPNAGYPVIVNRRTVYEGDPVVFAEKTAELISLGVKILGGCCGTTPLHISKLKAYLEEKTVLDNNNAVTNKDADKLSPVMSSERVPYDSGSCFWEKLVKKEKPVAVELDPPVDADLTKFMKGAKDLKEGGVDIITIADNPIGKARVDSSLLACKVHRELGIEALPHMTCRDRNLNATQGLMLGLYAEGIRNMLLVTGDPLPSAERDEVKVVYQFNSRKFASFATALSEKMFPGNVNYFGALNVNARNFDIQIKLAKEKLENGIVGFLTQPVLTSEAFENLKQARAELDGYILGGIIPVVSERNARFMNSEISGINVDEKVVSMYQGLNREEAEELAVKISAEIARRIEPYIDGYYFMTPFGRTGLIRKIIEAI